MKAKKLNPDEMKRLGGYCRMVAKKEKFTAEQADDFFDLSARCGLNARSLGTIIGAGFLQAVAGIIKTQHDKEKRE